ncbi:MAG TPA: hypothetical protein VKV80_01355 [Streptosporangiaceae bacterium]|nr:hypothetical protein [Streptosporangiaceae bacterium]
MSRRPAPLPLLAAQLAVLRAAFGDYHAALTARGDGTWHFEVTRIRGNGNPWCLISQDPREIYDALSAARPASQDT